jgi:hypothetical protein
MSAFSDYAENGVFDHLLRNTALTSPVTVYAALFTSAVNDDASGTEVTGGSYARQSVTFGAPSNGSGSNSVAVTFPTATAGWGTVTHVAIFDNSVGGNLILWGALTSSRVVQNGDIAKFNISALTATLT